MGKETWMWGAEAKEMKARRQGWKLRRDKGR